MNPLARDKDIHEERLAPSGAIPDIGHDRVVRCRLILVLGRKRRYDDEAKKRAAHESHLWTPQILNRLTHGRQKRCEVPVAV